MRCHVSDVMNKIDELAGRGATLARGLGLGGLAMRPELNTPLRDSQFAYSSLPVKGPHCDQKHTSDRGGAMCSTPPKTRSSS